jgi:hypothetical protein
VADVTAREFIAAVTEIAEQLPDGLDSAIELAICDGSAQQFIDSVEVLYQAYVRTDDSADPDRRPQVVIVGHWHPGESPGRVQRGIAADADEELRKLTGGDG